MILNPAGTVALNISVQARQLDTTLHATFSSLVLLETRIILGAGHAAKRIVHF